MQKFRIPLVNSNLCQSSLGALQGAAATDLPFLCTPAEDQSKLAAMLSAPTLVIVAFSLTQYFMAVIRTPHVQFCFHSALLYRRNND